MPVDFPDWTSGVVEQSSSGLPVVAQDFPDWTDGVVVVDGTFSATADFPDWTKAIWKTTPITPGPAPGFVSGGGAGVTSGGGGSLTIPRLPGEASGNFLVACIYSSFPSETITAPAGWTLQGSHITSFAQMLIYTLALTGPEPSGDTWTGTSSGLKCGIIDQFSGTSVLDGIPLFADSGPTGNTTPAAPSAGPSVTADTWLTFFCYPTYNSGITGPTGMTSGGFTGQFGTAPVGWSFFETLSGTDATGQAAARLSIATTWIACSVLVGP